MSYFNLKTFHKNLEILRKISGTNKSAFSAMLGVKNVFRKDYNSIGAKLLFGIQQQFEGVDKDWLLTDHDNEKIDITLKNRLPYGQMPEHKIPRDRESSRDSDKGSYGIPDLSSHKVKKIMASLTPEEMYLIEAIREIGPISRISIFSTAINQFNEAKRDDNIRNDKNKIAIIDNAIKILSKAISKF